MSTDIKAPQFPESVQDGSIATWHKKVGEPVSRDELLVDIETDKVVMEVSAPADGTLTEILKQEGDTVESAEVIAKFKAGSVAAAPAGDDSAPAADDKSADTDEAAASQSDGDKFLSPAARKIADENNIDPQSVQRSEEHTSELQSRGHLVCRPLL